MAIRSDPIEGGQADLRPVDPAELVHEARKTIKRMRALARLLRHELGEPEFGRVNDSLRIAAAAPGGCTRRRGATRDAASAGQASSKSARASSGSAHSASDSRASAERRSSRPTRDEVLADIADDAPTAGPLEARRARLQGTRPGTTTHISRRTRRRARVKRGHARNAQDLHDWRKRVKSLYYVLDMLGGGRVQAAHAAPCGAPTASAICSVRSTICGCCAPTSKQHPDAFERGQRDAGCSAEADRAAA